MGSFTSDLKKLRLVSNSFDHENENLKYQLLTKISKTKLPLSKALIEYQNLLLFIKAHPGSDKTTRLVQKEIDRHTKTLKNSSNKSKEIFINSGLPYTITRSSFTHDLWKILLNEPEIKINYFSSDEENIELNSILNFTLPDIEKEYTSAGLSLEDLLETLKVKKENQFQFIIDQLDKLNHVPFIKDYVLDKFNLYGEIIPTTGKFSKIHNHLKIKNFYSHTDLLKKFDHVSLVNTALPSPTNLSKEEQNKISRVMQDALALLERETDPCTFIDFNSLRYYELERGISVAIFGMIPERQLPVESYIGYTLFKNGFPCAYGGAWIYGSRALFGINIFEQFRGGESGFILMQLLRTYKQVFHLNYFEVEPYQYGLDNPEGIESGAFWFYYRYGFRPLDKTLHKLAQTEAEKIKNKKGYRSSSKTLIRFTESNIGWKIEGEPVLPFSVIREKTTDFISKKYKGNRENAIQDSLLKLNSKIPLSHYSDINKIRTLKDFALITNVLNIQSEKILNLIPQLVSKKSDDVYSYNQILTEFQKEIENRLKSKKN